jgi:hypothetical protein
MSKTLTFKMDAGDFLGRMTLLQAKKFPEAAREGLGRAGIALMIDTVEDNPTAPRDIPGEEKGESQRELWGSGAVFVESKKVEGSPFGDPVYQPEQVSDPQPMTAQIVFGAPYAARWHENLPKKRFTYPLAGTQFLRKKLVENIGKYAGLIAKEIRKTL